MRSSDSLRRGFTLIELLVVITILAFLAALTALFFPRFQERQQVESGSANLSSWLLIAKSMARRDGLPTGLRLVTATGAAPAGSAQFQYVQQPDDFGQGLYMGPAVNSSGQPMPLVAQFNVAANQALTRQVQSGDYLEIYGGGPPRRIGMATAVQRAANQLPLLDPNSTPLPTNTVTPTNTSATNYRIIPQARSITGEQMLTLPTDVIIDVPHSKMPPGNQILFAPSGAVLGSGAANPGYYYFYVRDNGQDTQRKITAGKQFEGNPRLIAVYPRTGFIATHPVNSNTSLGPVDYFLKDGRSSGM